MIDRPLLLRLIHQTDSLNVGHALRHWADVEIVLPSDEFELDQWPRRSIDSLLAVAAGTESDPYLDALRAALMIATPGLASPYPSGSSIGDIYDHLEGRASRAHEPLLQLLLANEASVMATRLSGLGSRIFRLLCWQQGCRLQDAAPRYLEYYLGELWLHWNSYPRPYAHSGELVPTANRLVRHLADLDDGRFERQRRLILVEAGLEMVIANLRATDAPASVRRCREVRADLMSLLDLLGRGTDQPQGEDGWVRPDSLAVACDTLSMAFFSLHQYQEGLQLLRLSLTLSGHDDAVDIVETVELAISHLGLIDAC